MQLNESRTVSVPVINSACGRQLREYFKEKARKLVNNLKGMTIGEDIPQHKFYISMNRG